jgi:hypothetical protein
MKKKAILLAVMFAGATTFAQDLTSKKGETMLPEAGDWAIQLDASPFLNYAGNLFNAGAISPTVGWVNTGAIAGKYFVDASTAYRVKLNIGFGSQTSKALVTDITAVIADPLSTAVVEDSRKDGTTMITLGGGLEMRRGNGRLQGIYGAELLFMMMSTKSTYTYGNTHDFTNIPTQTHGTDGAVDVLSTASGSTIGLAIRGFIGAEYFIAPKISIGAEYGWGLNMMSTGNGNTVATAVNSAGTALEDVTTETAGSGSFGIGADLNGGNDILLGSGNLVATFHF